MKVCFTGDVFLGGDLLNKQCKNLVNVGIFNRADARIINLEQPISDSLFVEDKCVLYTGSGAINQLKDLKIDAVNLAHNHIQDKGIEGIDETVQHIKSCGVGHFGAGHNIKAAEEPYWLTDDIAILGYCEFDKPYLREILVADNNSPGVNPLRLEKIFSDLKKLGAGKKAILYFHWGMEHVWLPTNHDICLAKKLLEDERVITIIGMHTHRIQGILEHSGKKAYMGIGNFIFPNFYMKPPQQIFNPSEKQKKSIRFTTRQYHNVFAPTYKKWRWVNRVSLVIDFCTETEEINHTYAVQADDSLKINELEGFSLYFYKNWIRLLNFTFKFTDPVYKLLWRFHSFEVKLTWRLQIMWFHLKQLGLKIFLLELFNYVKNKLK